MLHPQDNALTLPPRPVHRAALLYFQQPPSPRCKWYGLCITGGGVGGQVTDAAHSGPGAGVSPYEWMDSCAGCFLRKNLAFVFRVLHSGHMLMYMYRTAGAETGNFAFQVTLSLQFHRVCFRKAQILCCIPSLWTAHFYLTDQAEEVLRKHFHLQRHVHQLITNGSLCVPFMHEGACML